MAVVSSCFDVYNSVCITNAVLLKQKKKINFFFYCKQKSSPHDLSILGYTRITKIKTKKFKEVILRNFQKLSQCRVISEIEMMKLKSLVTVNYYVTANYCNNFAHTAHHIQRVFILKRVNFSFLNVKNERIYWYFNCV